MTTMTKVIKGVNCVRVSCMKTEFVEVTYTRLMPGINWIAGPPDQQDARQQRHAGSPSSTPPNRLIYDFSCEDIDK